MDHLSARQMSIYLTSVLAFILIPEVLPWSNFFREYQGVYQNRGYGQYLLNRTEFVPSCGWKLILTTPVAFTTLETWDTIPETSDNYTFILTSGNGKHDLRNVNNPLYNMNYQGPFWNTLPDIYITWYCVCDNTTSGECLNVYNSTTTTSTTSRPSTQTPVTNDYSELKNPLLGNYTTFTASQQTRSGLCYIGQQKTIIARPVHLVDCGSICSCLPKCTGLNYRAGARQCDLVYENVEMNSNLLKQVNDCYFWRIMNKL